MNDVDRWINSEGPEPEGIRELMEDARRVPDLPPGEAARLKQSIRRAVAERRRADRRPLQVGAGAVVALGIAAGVVLALRSSPQSADADSIADKPMPTQEPRARELPTLNPEDSEPKDAGPARPPRRRRP